jgi:hypothetical protein
MSQISSSSAELEAILIRFARALVSQENATIIVPPNQPRPGYWFGGGNLAQAADGTLYLVGRYRNAGDSRSGLAAGERGLELAIFRAPGILPAHGTGVAPAQLPAFEKALSFSKQDLTSGSRAVLSIEGAALRIVEGRVELFVSSEKDHVGYPSGYEQFLKPGTGVWSIDRLATGSIEGLPQTTIEPVLGSRDPRFMHIKDPSLYERPDGSLVLLFCSHPYCWTSSNTGYAIREPGGQSFGEPVFDGFPRGHTWDVAITRATCLVDLPPVGALHDKRISLLFYDGGECVRNHDEHQQAVHRARGYSCEEVGGAAYVVDGDLSRMMRLSKHQPLFVSPHGTGCSRYVDVLATEAGYYATWQQSQPDGSQPLVMNFLPRAAAEQILQGA